ncbi:MULTISPECIES: ATP-grasp domain-containing protein [Bacillus]|uniref:ATP-grasp domain-containing protein n=1 Tax=Bacillus TaxID=1386 RepID=UPI0002D23C28|nr:MULTISPECIES: ATP-grasp domain-containing protein [Bacillus]MEB9337480.1 ATP-grasp domain-containing protein [Bacillus cereus]CCW04922.1 conserved domain protein [Bacillus sp. GeD10]HEF1856997.1 ATP-grasp domain-containing protein [Bacillus cereus]HEF1869340.1 ATP-grasp domain-containing protein [Bacillus cereus]HEF1879892.1 ATP-grasp domain-containing protein [Bacillus cereus]
MNTKKTVLITGVRAPATLHLCRLLKKDGHTVIIADSIPYPLTKVSRSADYFYEIPSPKWKTNECISVLQSIIQNHEVDLLIPTCEETFYIARYKKELSLFCHILVDDFPKLALLHNKWEFIQLVTKLGWQVPATYKTNNEQAIQVMLQQTSPVTSFVLKPIFSRFSDKVMFITKKDIARCVTMGKQNYIIQEFIKGTQHCSYSIVQSGKVLAHSIYKTEFTAGLGATIAFKHISVPKIDQFVQHVVKELNFSGQIAFDFIVTEDGDPIPIECNPRTTSGLHLFDEEILSAFFDKKGNNMLIPKPNSQCAIQLAMLLYGMPYLKSRQTRKRWWKILYSYPDIIYSGSDNKPFFYQFYSMYKLWRESYKHGRTISEQTTCDISWDGENL